MIDDTQSVFAFFTPLSYEGDIHKFAEHLKLSAFINSLNPEEGYKLHL